MNQRVYWAIGLACAAFFLFANAGFWGLVSRTREMKKLERSLAHLRADHQAFAKEWAMIQQDPSYTEYLIRKNLGFVKKGEVEYQLIKKDK